MQMKYFHSKSFRSKTIRPRFFFTKIYQAMFLSCVLILSPVVLFSVQTIEACAQENDKDGTASELYALSAVLMDADNGRILLQKNGTEVLPMASTTKIMTCILALEQANPDDYVSVSSYAAGMPKVHLGVRKGDVFRLGDLLYSLMLESHNDSAAIIAEHVGNCLAGGGKRSADNSEEESKEAILRFAGLMNAKAEEIGCADTFFVTPNGLDAILTYQDDSGNEVQRQHSTTASDLARIMSYCIMDSPKKEEFLTITRTPAYSFSDYKLGEDGQWAAGGRQFSCNNHNAFLNMMEGALSGKTGFTGKAGYCYVGALARDGKTFTIALLACGWPNHKSWKWHDAKLLYEYGLSNFEKRNIYEKADLSPVPVEGGICEDTVLQVQEQDISLLLSEQDEVHMELEVPDSLTAPVEAGKTVGWETYYVNGEVYAQLPITTAEDVLELTYRYCLDRILELFWL